ncbi:hypothetical protein ACFQ5F_12195 [Kroppenstedtia eburnea]|uniref:hypothetical protein n=1 Tax=Kroppenstedtia eburnea TaxID=714067 RepID=UPI003644369D
MSRGRIVFENFLGALIVNIISLFTVGFLGWFAASFPMESEFWWIVLKYTLILIAIGSIIGAILQIYTNPILEYTSKLIVFNIAFLYLMIISWRGAGEPLVFGIILFTLYVLCIYVGIRYREFVQQESFRPKTKIGKVIVSIGVLSSVGAGFAGYNIGKSEGAETFFVIVCPIFACLFTLFFNSALKQIEDQVEEQKQQQS